MALGTQLKTRFEAWQQTRIDRADERALARRARNIELEERRMERRLRSTLRRDGRRTARAIRDAATNLGLCHIRTSGRKAGTISEIKFGEMVCTPAAIYLRVKQMPFRTNTMMLEEPYVLQDLSHAARNPIRIHHSPDAGLWIVIERSGLASIPRHVEYAEILPMLPKSAPPTAFPLGLGASRKFYYADLATLPHVLIAGQTGGGKSVMLHNIICTMAQRSNRDNLQFVMIDLKGRVELTVYGKLPQLSTIGGLEQKIYGVHDITDVLQALNAEGERRMALFEREGVRNVDRWNFLHRGPRYLPKIVVVVDELANAMLQRGVKNKIEPLIANIGAQGRAPGIHLVVTTQHPITDVVTSLLKANLPGRIAFSTVGIPQSVVILDSKEAFNVGPPGRFVFRSENKKAVIQGPFLDEGLVDDIIAGVCSGVATEALLPHGVSELAIATWCIEYKDGVFAVDSVYEQFRPSGISHREVRRLQAELLTTGKSIAVGDRFFVLKQIKSNLRRFEEMEVVDSAI